MKNEPSHSRVQRFLSIVQQSFRSLQRKYKVALGVIVLTVILGGLFTAGILESIFYLPAGVKIALAALLLMGAAAAFIYYYRRLNGLTLKEFYHQFSKKTGEPRLSDALDLHFDPNPEKPPLQEAAIRQNLEKLNPEELKAGLNRYSKNHPIHTYYRAGLSGAFGTLILLVGFMLLQPEPIKRFSHLWVNYTPPNPYSYTIDPGSLTLEQGETFTPHIRFEGDYPKQLTLAFKTDIEEQFRQRSPITIENQQAAFSPISLTTHGRYYFEMDGFRSKEFRVTVHMRPRFEELMLKVVPPAYTGLDSTVYSYPFSKISTYRGSEITLSGRTNKPVSQLSMSRSAPDTATAIADDSADFSQFDYRWTVASTDTVSFNMSDSVGLSNKNKFRFVVEPREDQHPFVNLIEPSENIQMKNPETLSLDYEAGDDFGLTGASLHFELQRAFTTHPEKGSQSLPIPAMNKVERYNWELPKLNPKPRDVLTYWIEVRDNDGYNGAKTGRSQKMTITFPSVTEYMDELDSRENEISESMDDLSQSFERMQQEYDQFKNQLKQNPETNWEQKQQLEEVEEERKKVDQQVEELNKKFEEIRREIEDSQAMSPETMEKYDELQKLMKEINNPELQKALEELQKSLGQMSPEQMRKALENYEFNEEQYRQRINRTLELFKSLKLNSDLEKMARSLDEVSEQEKQLSESEQSADEDLEQQEAIQEDLNNIQKQIEELDKNASQKSRKQIESLQQDAGQRMEELQKQLRQNMDRLKKQKGQQTDPQTKQQQQRIQKQIEQMAGQMRDAKQQLNQRRLQVNMRALEYILYSLIDLSVNQEELTKETETLPNRSQSFADKARIERNISGQFSMLSDSLFKVSSEIPSFSNRINKKKAEVEQYLSNAVNMLAERDKSNSTFAQRQSLGGINELASMVASLLEQLQNSQQGGGGGAMSMQQFMEQLKQMSGQQQKLNEEIQNMINDIQGNRLTQDQMERINQMSRQQNQIRKQLEELQRKGGLESGDRVLSELERMSEQMEDAINDLRGGQLDRRLMERQQNILSRMLSAEDAIQERGEEERREATTAEEQEERAVPPDITLEELQQRVRKMLNDPNRTKYTEDFQRLIEQYFELLREQDKEILQ